MTVPPLVETVTVYVSIGNSDDKLTQAQWGRFWDAVNLTLYRTADQVHGQWMSNPVSAWQNACWCVTFTPSVEVVDHQGRISTRLEWVRTRMSRLAADYGQDSVGWAVADVELIAAEEGD